MTLMFYILRTVDPPFASTPAETIVVATCSNPAELPALMQKYKGAAVAESLWTIGDGVPLVKKVPAELQRAVEKWNEIAPRATPPLPRVKKVEPFVTAYRRWKARNGNRTYLLESVVEKVEGAKWTHQWIRFGWLLGQKGGDEHAEQILDGRQRFTKPRRQAAGDGGDFEAVER